MGSLARSPSLFNQIPLRDIEELLASNVPM
jgi:hypothetical protein